MDPNDNPHKNLHKLTIDDLVLSFVKQEMITEIVPIKGYIDMILAAKFGSINEIQKEKLGIASNQIDKLLSIISELNIAKLDEIKHTYNLDE